MGNAAAALQNWEIITGFLLPLVLAFLIQSGWKRSTQAVVAFATSAAVVLVQLYLRGDLHGGAEITTSILKVVALTTAFYNGFWKPTTVTTNIEEKSNVANLKAAISGKQPPGN